MATVKTVFDDKRSYFKCILKAQFGLRLETESKDQGGEE
jgi:hypothetical protein